MIKKYEKYTRKTYIESEIDKFLEKYEYQNVHISYGDKGGKKIDTEKITKSLKKLRNKIINPSELKEDYNKFMDNFKNFEDYKYGKEEDGVSKNQKKMKRYAKGLEYIADIYNLKSDSDTSKKR